MHIHVKRYSPEMPAWAATVEPAGREWILFVAKDGGARLYERATSVDEDGQTIEGYVDTRDVPR